MEVDGQVLRKTFQVAVFSPITVKKFGAKEVHTVGVIVPKELTDLLDTMDTIMEDCASEYTSNVKKIARETMFFKLKVDDKGKYECNKTLKKTGLEKGKKCEVELQFNAYFNAKEKTAGISIEVVSLK